MGQYRSRESWATGKSDLFEQTQMFAGIATPKLTNTPAVIFSYPCRN